MSSPLMLKFRQFNAIYVSAHFRFGVQFEIVPNGANPACSAVSGRFFAFPLIASSGTFWY